MKIYIKPEIIIKKFDCIVASAASMPAAENYVYSAEVMNRYLFDHANAMTTTTVKVKEILGYEK